MQKLSGLFAGCLLLFLATSKKLYSQSRVITFEPAGTAMQIAGPGSVAQLYADSADWKGVWIALGSLQADFGRVTGLRPDILHRLAKPKKETKTAIIVGTVGRSALIDGLIKAGKINVAGVAGKWESTLIQVVDHPMAGIDKALVIAGSDKRGTIFGIYELSRQIGVSPWNWWADVPIPQKTAIYALSKKLVLAQPAVKYRGIFLNDEAPALSGWTKEKFGGFNHKFYIKVFELLLRLKANYLWPAMWGSAFNDDDSLNPVLADTYGIVMGTSHHEPMLRAQQEWKRYGKGAWNYQENEANLKDFWKTGIQHMGNHESIVTVGMRGDGDMPMTEGSNIALLEKIVKDQRAVIGEVTGKDPSKTPQLWALYKEVQDYYDKGMRVPDDVTLLLCDDNWGNLRKLPKLTDKARSGGYGIYYHFDYVGGPRNYKWINTNTISKTWEQMHLAYKYGVDRIWIVNVGDLKPMEFPISFFLDFARDPEALPYESLKAYTVQWCEQQFGAAFAPATAEIMDKYTKYNERVKPELLNSKTYSLVNGEWAGVTADYKKLVTKSEAIYQKLPKAYQAAFFELVLYPVKASANLYQLYEAQAKNHLFASQGRSATNLYADSVAWFYQQDSLLSYTYNKINADGKWNHMMDQTHIGYTYWQQPEHNSIPAVRRITVPEKSALGVAIIGDTTALPLTAKQAATHTLARTSGLLPVLNPYTSAKTRNFITVFNRGKAPLNFNVKTDAPWIKLKHTSGVVKAGSDGASVGFDIDWMKAPSKIANAPVIIQSGKQQVKVWVRVNNNPAAVPPTNAFVGENHIISFNAGDFQHAKEQAGVHWKVLPGIGKTKNAIEPFPVTFETLAFSKENPSVSYRFFSQDSGKLHMTIFVSPTFDMWSTGGLEFALSIDGQEPQVININKGFTERNWGKDVAGSIRKIIRPYTVERGGLHTLKVWAMTPGVLIQKFELDFNNEKPAPAAETFLGAPTSYFAP
ncbi:MAG TPA: glycosyl hydrolase 115 family protein [Arachidicoccus sp.]|nr:glycosyl hydrolase 115 family protein [Arachidicoccus sp.]